MKKVLVLFAVVLMCAAVGNAQLLLNENFSYGGSDNSDITTATGNYTRHSGAQGPQYSSTSLTYSGYASSGIDGSISFTNGGLGVNDGDVHRVFTEVNTTNNVYVSFLVNVTSALATQDYFIHLGPTTIGTTFRGRVYARSNASGWSLSLSKTGTPIVQDATVLNFSQTYLVVLKYIFSTAGVNDDEVELYVYDSGVPASEPGSPIVTMQAAIGSGVTDGLTNLGSVAIRQATNCPTAKVDGIRIATDWDNAPVPVELTSFNAIAKGRGVELVWKTATEVNNHGFEVERATMNRSLEGNGSLAWSKIGFVEGHGTTNAPQSYSFVDAKAEGTVSYRLKQIDRDGQFEYSQEVEVMISQMPQMFTLMQNYPNPFNPSTAITYSVPNTGKVSLSVYDMLGKEVASLVNGVVEAGEHTAQFNASQLPSGMYFYTIRTNNFTETKKMTLVK